MVSYSEYYKLENIVKSRLTCTNNKGLVHRIGGPAREGVFANDNICYREWLINGIYHRTDGPARELYYENGVLRCAEWLVNGIYHRTDGPACVEFDSKGNIIKKKYFLMGKELTEEDFNSTQL